ncbi:MAG: 4-hydroxy-tetrahydrodipicolinate reductase [Aureispira sp.]
MKIALLGYGKMGRFIERLALEQGHEVVLRIDQNNADRLTPTQLQLADVAIEFSRPDTAFANIMHCLKAGVPVVSGTTAWLDDYPKVVDWCTTNGGAFFYASNFSIGVNIFFELNQHLARLMDAQAAYSVALEEIHHTQKLDAPSGTAVTLAEGILEKVDRLERYDLQQEAQAASPDGSIPITAHRVGDTPGTHVVTYDSGLDTLEIKHTAKGRAGFATGALMAAQWLIGKEGVFGMSDLLQLN